MTGLEAQEAAISSFGPAGAVLRAHRRRTVTAAAAAMAAWKLAGLLAVTVGAGGLATVFWLHFDPGGAPGVQVVTASNSFCQCSPGLTALTSTAPPLRGHAAGGLALLATRRLATRWLARRGARAGIRCPRRYRRASSRGVSALLSALNASGVGAVTHQLIWNSPVSDGTATMTAPLVPGVS
jgi:hypothetical protein